VWKPERKRPLGRPRIRRENNIKRCHQEVRYGLDWIDLSHDRDVWRSLWSAVKKSPGSAKMCGIS